jgi:hypothetical protein
MNTVTAKSVTSLAQETRATLPTHEAAFHLNLASQTMRIYACKENGPLVPIRICGRLHWRTDDIRRLLCVGGRQVKKASNTFATNAPLNAIVLLAPWCANRQQQVLRVKSVQISAALPWPAYYRYLYLSGVGVKLDCIPRHICGNAASAIEQLERAQRLISFMDATGCRPLGTEECPRTHSDIVLLDWPDHLTYWLGPDGVPLVLVEPYTLREDLQKEIAARKLTALILRQPGIYGGGGGKTSSVLLAAPQNAGCLQQLSVIDWSKSLGEVQDVSWFDALSLGKERQS